MLLASVWAPKTPPKWVPKGVQNRTLKNIDFAAIYNTWATFEGHENHHFWSFFGTLFKYRFWTSFLSILDHFGDPFGALWAPKKHPKKDTKKRYQKRAQRGTCLSKGTGSALKCKIVVPSTFQVAPCCWLCSHHVYSPMHFKASNMHVMWSSAAPAALPWPRPTHWEKQLQCDAATMLKCYSEMKANTSRIQPRYQTACTKWQTMYRPHPNHIQEGGSNTAISPTTSPKTKKQALWTQWVRALIYVQKPSKIIPK